MHNNHSSLSSLMPTQHGAALPPITPHAAHVILISASSQDLLVLGMDSPQRQSYLNGALNVPVLSLHECPNLPSSWGAFLLGFLLPPLQIHLLAGKKCSFSCLTMSIASTIIVFSTNVWVYNTFRFLIGFCRSSVGTCSLVLLTERVCEDWRFRVGVLDYIWFTLGFLSLPAIAYVNRDSAWKYLYLWTSVPGIFYSIFAYIFVRVSQAASHTRSREKSHGYTQRKHYCFSRRRWNCDFKATNSTCPTTKGLNFQPLLIN